MKCYIDKFKSQHDLDEICKELLSWLSDDDINDILIESKVLRLKCNLLRKMDILVKLPRDKIESGILSLYKTNKKLSEKISEKWNEKIKKIEKIKDLEYDEAKDILEKKEKPEYLFKYATLFWSKNEEVFNLLGDKIYEKYLLQHSAKKLMKRRDGNMDKSILDTSLGEILNVFKDENCEKQHELEESIQENSEEIKEVSAQMGICIKFNKDIKKMLNNVIEMVNKLEKQINNNQSAINDRLAIIDEEVSLVFKEIKDVREKSEQTYSKQMKNINANMKSVNDSLKNQNKTLQNLEKIREDITEKLSNISKEANNFKDEKGQVATRIDHKMVDTEEKDLKEIHINAASKMSNSCKEDNGQNNTFNELLDELLNDK